MADSGGCREWEFRQPGPLSCVCSRVISLMSLNTRLRDGPVVWSDEAHGRSLLARLHKQPWTSARAGGLSPITWADRPAIAGDEKRGREADHSVRCVDLTPRVSRAAGVARIVISASTTPRLKSEDTPTGWRWARLGAAADVAASRSSAPITCGSPSVSLRLSPSDRSRAQSVAFRRIDAELLSGSEVLENASVIGNCSENFQSEGRRFDSFAMISGVNSEDAGGVAAGPRQVSDEPHGHCYAHGHRGGRASHGSLLVSRPPRSWPRWSSTLYSIT